MLTIPDGLRRQILAVDGEAGRAWLKRLPILVAEIADEWSLRIGEPFSNLSYNWVAPATMADGRPAIVKLGVPRPELLTEIAALRWYDDDGIAQLYEADLERGALLLERIEPGTTLWNMENDERATTIAASVMRRLWKPAPAEHAFPTVADWADGLRDLRACFDGGTGPFPRRLVEMAEALFAELIPSQAMPVVLHGDLHHDNILAGTREPWLAIDPKGVVGEPVYEVGALLRNPYPRLAGHPDLRRLTARRIDQLAELLGFDRARIRGWALAQAVLAAWWTFESKGRLDPVWIAVAEAIEVVNA